MLEGFHWASLVTAVRWSGTFYKLSCLIQKRKQNCCFLTVNCFSSNNNKSKWCVFSVSPPNSVSKNTWIWVIGISALTKLSRLAKTEHVWRRESQYGVDICGFELPRNLYFYNRTHAFPWRITLPQSQSRLPGWHGAQACLQRVESTALLPGEVNLGLDSFLTK